MRALVLEGGGAKGSYEVGAYKALKELGYEFDYIVGTSIGSVNGAMFVQGDEEIAERIWGEIKFSTIVDADDEKMKSLFNWEMSVETLHKNFSTLKDILMNRGLSTAPFRELMDKYIDEDRVRSSKIKFGLCTVNISDKKPVEMFADEMPDGTLKDYIMASSYLPVFRFEPLGGKYYIDGGLYANVPYKMVDDLCDEITIIGVNVDGKDYDELTGDKYTLIKPREELGRSINFDRITAGYNIKLGYYDTLRHFNRLEGDKYYIKPIDEHYALNIITESLKDICRDVKSLRAMLEEFNRDIKATEIDDGDGYDRVLISVLDRAAFAAEVERFRVYTVNELAKKIKNASRRNEKRLGKIEEAIINRLLMTD